MSTHSSHSAVPVQHPSSDMPNQWSPSQVLQLYLCRLTSKCSGVCKDGVKRCTGDIHRDNRAKIAKSLAEMARKNPGHCLDTNRLRELARLALCKRIHQNQIEVVAFTYRQALLVEEQRWLSLLRSNAQQTLNRLPSDIVTPAIGTLSSPRRPSLESPTTNVASDQEPLSEPSYHPIFNPNPLHIVPPIPHTPQPHPVVIQESASVPQTTTQQLRLPPRTDARMTPVITADLLVPVRALLATRRAIRVRGGAPSAPSAIVTPTAGQPQVAAHPATRQVAPNPLPDECPICFEQIQDGEEVVYCRRKCDTNVHRECYEPWRERCLQVFYRREQQRREEYRNAHGVYPRESYARLQERRLDSVTCVFCRCAGGMEGTR